MILVDVTLDDFQKETEGKEIICVGGGGMLDFLYKFQSPKLLDRIKLIADNNITGQRSFGERTVNVIPTGELNNVDLCNKALLITTMYCRTVYEQLNALLSDSDVRCYIYPLMSLRVKSTPKVRPQLGEQRIPKKIHYFWFGKGEIPRENRRCIGSWSRFCPDYEIIRWTEKEYDVTKCEYMRQSYEAKKWGFVPDYARLDVLYEQGGIYLDTDVELIRSLDDLLFDDGYMGFQRSFAVGPGLGFGCKKGLDIIREMRDAYNDIQFITPDGLNQTTSPAYQTEILKKHGLLNNNTEQYVAGVHIYPTDYFDPMGYSFGKIELTENTHSIHHYSESHADKEVRADNLIKYEEINSFR